MSVKGRIEKLENVLGVRQEEMTIEEKMKVCGVSVMAVVASILTAEPGLPKKEVISRFETIIKNMPIPARNVTSRG